MTSAVYRACPPAQKLRVRPLTELVLGQRVGVGGCPPWTTLSRIPRGHSGEPRDAAFGLRRSCPEDTGPGRTPPNPHPPRWAKPYGIRGPWTSTSQAKALGPQPVEVRCPHVPRARWVEAGQPPRTRIFWGASSKRQTQISWPSRVATGNAAQRGPRRLPPPPPAELSAGGTGQAAGAARQRFHAVW